MLSFLFLVCLLQEQTAPPQEATSAPSALALAAQARGVPETPPRTPSEDYLLKGEVSFHFPERPIVTQQLDVWLGGPAQLRYAIQDKNRSNVFLFAGDAGCWVKTPSEKQARPYDAQALTRDTWLRWAVLRFPWGWKFPKPDIAHFIGTLGTIEAKLNNHLPSVVHHGSLALKLSKWNKQGIRMPAEWHWDYGGHQIIESYALCQAKLLFLENAFLPANHKREQSTWTALRHEPDASPSSTPEQIALVQQDSMTWAECESDQAHWLRISQNGEIQPTRPAADHTQGAQLRPPSLCLRWTTWTLPNPKRDAQQLRNAAKQNGLTPIGAIWCQVVPDDGRQHPRVILLPVKQND